MRSTGWEVLGVDASANTPYKQLAVFSQISREAASEAKIDVRGV